MKKRRTLLFLFFSIILVTLTESSNSDIIEGSGISPISTGINKNIVAADIDWEASGVGPDDEDGDVIEGSGNIPQKHDIIEGSGISPYKPVIIPDEPKDIIQNNKVIESTHDLDHVNDDDEIKDEKPIVGPVATTVITITKDEVGKDNIKPPHLYDNANGFDTFGVNAKTEEEEESEEDEEDQSTETIITTTIKQTTEITTKKPFIPVVTDPPIIDDDDSMINDNDPLKNMLQPGILAAITGGAVVGILLAILLIMFIIYRIRKKDEGSYSVDESSHHPPNYTYAYQKAATQEFYA